MISHDEIETVRVCMKCGRGFTAWSDMQSGAVDTYRTHETWYDVEGPPGEPCLGRVLDVSRHEQLRKVQQHEQDQSDNA